MATIKKVDDTWEVRYDAGFDGKGKRIQKRKRGFKTKKEAEKFLVEIQNSINNNSYVEPEKILLSEYLSQWLDSYVRPNLAPKTVTGYERMVDKYTIPHIGQIPLQKLKPMDIQELYIKLQKEGRLDSSGGLSAKSILYVHRVLSKALKQAEQLQLISRNPAAVVSPPKVKKFESKPYDQNEIREMLEKFKIEEIYVPVLLAAALGFRRGEALGLQWSDIDFDNRIITVNNNLVSDDYEIIETTPKSDTSKRAVVVSDNIIKILREHKKKQLEYKLALGPEYHDSDYVCTYRNGKIYNPANFSKLFKNALKRHELRHIRFHDLRHSNATLMLRNNVPAKVASARLGHSTIAITMDLYSHVMQDMQEDAAEKIEASIF